MHEGGGGRGGVRGEIGMGRNKGVCVGGEVDMTNGAKHAGLYLQSFPSPPSVETSDRPPPPPPLPPSPPFPSLIRRYIYFLAGQMLTATEAHYVPILRSVPMTPQQPRGMVLPQPPAGLLGQGYVDVGVPQLPDSSCSQQWTLTMLLQVGVFTGEGGGLRQVCGSLVLGVHVGSVEPKCGG